MSMLEYRIVRTHRRTIGIIISPTHGVTVRAPLRASDKEIQQFVKIKTQWIKKHLESFTKKTCLNKNSLKEGDKILFRGQEYTVSLIPSTINQVELHDNIIGIKTSRPDDQKAILRVLERWYKINAEIHLRKLFGMIILKHSNRNFNLKELHIRKMKRKWGSCSSSGRITINRELIKLDDTLAEYVITHEICHLFKPNHSKEFYQLLGELEPNWRELIKKLSQYYN